MASPTTPNTKGRESLVSPMTTTEAASHSSMAFPTSPPIEEGQEWKTPPETPQMDEKARSPDEQPERAPADPLDNTSTNSQDRSQMKGESLDEESLSHDQSMGGHLNATEDDILEAKELASNMSLEDVCKMMKNVLQMHDGDPNFPFETLQSIRTFLADDSIIQHPEKNTQIIEQMKLEAALIQSNSPYEMVRAVVDNHDDPEAPASTIRAWVLAVFFSVVLSSVNQLFSIRQPPITINTNVAQLLSYPLGKAWERWMPRKQIRFPFTSHSIPLNPGRFNKKEHMLIAIAANTAESLPYTNFLIFVQVLPNFFNMKYASNFGYIFLNALATNFIGYGLAGLTRKFLVYPSYCVWPTSLVTIALNNALHKDENHPVMGPFKKIFRISRYKFFMIAFAVMFVYFWFPNYIFQALSYFNWMTWPAPDNVQLTALTGMVFGLGLLNVWPTFDWNIVCFLTDPLLVPSFITFNIVGGMWLSGWVVYAMWRANVWNFGYLPVNTNKVFDHYGAAYNVSNTIDDHAMFDQAKYEAYSAPYLSSGYIMLTVGFFASYTAIITHVVLYHRYELKAGFKSLWRSSPLNKKSTKEEDGSVEGEYQDVHNRLMAVYPEVPEWWFFIVLVISIVAGVIAVACWPTYTSPAVVLFGVALSLIFVVPVGIVNAMTGVQVTIQGLAEYIGGLVDEGNAMSMNFFKTYGYTTCFHALSFAADLKLAHYLKIPPRVTFSAQMIATLISTFISSGILKYQLNIEGVCGLNPPMRFTCPGPNTFYSASVLWGTIGPTKIFGPNGEYTWLLFGFPIGVVLVLIPWALKKKFPNNRALRQVHIVVALTGVVQWGNYNFSYGWPAVPIAWLSWIYVKKRHLAFWSKYNYVLAASWSTAIAISGLIMLFSVQWANVNINWWGNTRPYTGCEAVACPDKTLGLGEKFSPWWKNAPTGTPTPTAVPGIPLFP